MRRNLLPIALILSALPVGAQQGNRKDHDNMSSVVPADQVPPAPVLTPQQALKTMAVAPGFVLEPLVTEPLVEKPVALDYDGRGRMWVCEMRGFMPDIDGKDETKPQGRIVILSDSDGDGKPDKREVFLDGLLLPRAIAVFRDGILFIDEQKLCWVDRNGDKPAGEPKVLDAKFSGGGNVEHKPNGLLWGLDNWLYNAKSDKRLRRINGQWKIESSANRGQWGISKDDYGRLYHNNNSTSLFGEPLAPDLLRGNPAAKMKVNDYTQLGSNRVWPSRVTPAVNRAYMAKKNGYNEDILDPKTFKLTNTTAACGPVIYRGTNFPSEWRNSAFVCEPSGNLVKAIRIEDSPGKIKGTDFAKDRDFLTSTDERFRPVTIMNAPDGSLYVLDMYHGIIQHKTYMTTYLREQTLSRGLDKPPYDEGRIYRLRSTNGKLEKPVDLEKLETASLVRGLDYPNGWHRDFAQRILIERKDPAATAELEAFLTKAKTSLGKIHAIWTLEGLEQLKAAHVVALLKDQDPKVVSSALWAATRLPETEAKTLESTLISFQPTNDEVSIYFARALGTVGTPGAMDRLAALIKESPKKPFIREAAVSGVAGKGQLLLDALSKQKVNDKDLTKWLNDSLKAGGSEQKVTLTGEALASFNRGKTLYTGELACFGCHGPDGLGLPNLGPPLDGSEWVTGDPKRTTKILLHGMTGPLTVAGQHYKPAADMPGLHQNPTITDAKLADVLTYIRNEWGNKAGGAVAPSVVTETRSATADHAGRPYTEKELK